jgi:putative ABC transport system permease protein
VLRIALRSLRARKLRAALIGVAIMLGTAMISGTYILTDQITGAFDEIFERANEGVDVILGREEEFTPQQTQVGPISEELVDTVRAVDGVAAAEGLVQDQGVPVVDGEPISSQGAPSFVFSTPTERFQTNQLVAGRFPTASGEAAIEIGIADREKLRVGQQLGLQTRTGLKPITLVGTFRFGEANGIGGAILTAITLEDAQAWFRREGRVNSIVVAAAPGVSAAALQQRIAAAVPADIRVETGDQNADRQADDINDNLGFLRVFLFIFAGVAILVGAFIILNVFSITVAQRTRELAMLRTIGAYRGQLMRSVITEAALIGLVASVIGAALGVLFAKGLNAIFDAAGFGLPTTGITIKPRTIIVPLVIGVLATTLAALLPAIRATRVAPVAALREGAVLAPSRFARFTPAIGAGLLVLGVLSIVAGFRSDAELRQQLSLIGFGAFLVLIGVGMLGRLLIRPLARFVGAPLRALFGTPARLGRANAMRDPARTASTAAALMIGVGLVVFVAVFVDGFKSSFLDAIDRSVNAELIVINDSFLPLPAAIADAAETASGSPTAIGIGFAEVEVDGERQAANGIDPAAARSIVRFDWQNGGSDAALDQLGSDGAIVERNFAESTGLTVGERFTATNIDGTRTSFTVRGIYKDPQLFTGFTLGTEGFRRVSPDQDVGVLLVDFPGATSPDEAKRATEAVLNDTFPSATVRTRDEYKDYIGTQVNQVLAIFYVLLTLSVLISIIGVIITLLLAVYERTREIGMLRAVGTTRWQTRLMIGFEGIITCVIGGLIGLAVGLFLGWIMIRALEGEGLTFSVPVGTLIAVVILTAVAGLVASAFPARRAARLKPLDALHYE